VLYLHVRPRTYLSRIYNCTKPANRRIELRSKRHEIIVILTRKSSLLIAYITLVHTLPLSTAHYDFTAAQFVINCTQNYALVIPSSVTCNSANVTFTRCIYNAAGSSPAAENGSLPVTVSSDERDPILSSVEADVGLTGSVEAYENKAFRQQKGDEGEVKVLIDDGPSTGRHQGASLIGCETASNLDQEVSFERAYQ